MKSRLLAAALTMSLVAPVALPTPAFAQHRDGRDRQWQGDQDGNWEPSEHYDRRRGKERRLSQNDRIYRGRDGRAYCKRGDGTTGLVVGAVGGGVLANLIGGGTLGTLAGAGGGALLGRSLDRGKVRCR